jgi:hypothetical protein
MEMLSLQHLHNITKGSLLAVEDPNFLAANNNVVPIKPHLRPRKIAWVKDAGMTIPKYVGGLRRQL